MKYDALLVGEAKPFSRSTNQSRRLVSEVEFAEVRGG